MSININILGDFCPIGKLESSKYQNNINWLGDLKTILQESDFNIVNLEYPLTNVNNKIRKSGPHLKASPETVEILNKIGINVVTLTNNHIMDYGEEGFFDTINTLKKYNVQYVGAGKDIQEARKPLILCKEGSKIAIVNFCEKEFSIATDNSPGAAPLDLIWNFEDIQKAKNMADYVIVIVHGGAENYQYPTPRQVKTYRFFASLGICAVIGHHSHCIQQWEEYNGVPICYSLGNFVFDEKNNPDSWFKGLLISLTPQKPSTLIKIYPFTIVLIPSILLMQVIII